MRRPLGAVRLLNSYLIVMGQHHRWAIDEQRMQIRGWSAPADEGPHSQTADHDEKADGITLRFDLMLSRLVRLFLDLQEADLRVVLLRAVEVPSVGSEATL
jgi:hypothetical protein